MRIPVHAIAVCVLLLMQGRIAQAAPPNVVLILSDDQAWTDYGFMGHEHIQTPHLDQLARESLTFTRGYVPDSLCRPSLTTIITGRYPHQHGIVGNDPPPPADLVDAPKGKVFRDPRYLAIRNRYIEHIDDEQTLPDLLADYAGYLSHQSGKWWEGNFSRGGFTHGMTHGDRTRGGRHGDLGLNIGREGLKPVFDFMDMARKEEKPFFVWYAPFMPHTPHTPPERLLNKYKDKTPHLAVAKYWAMCEWFDETCGELMGYLDEHQLAENTIVVYVCDNGWINREDVSAYAPKSKRSQYDGGTRTPIMVRWKGHITPRMDTTHLASSIDLVPTVLAAAGAAVPESLPGINLCDEAAVAKRKAIFGEILEHDIQDMDDPVASLRFRWVIDGTWKLIVPHPGREPNAPVELYDLASDPAEEHNLANQQPERVSDLRKEIDAWWPVH